MPTLQWLTRDQDLQAANKIPYRLLEEVPDLGFGDRSAGNMLIQGDNLDALKALLPFYAGQVKCVYIDPPYNTKSAFEHYDDNLEHTKWLSLMWPRLELLCALLSEEGSIWISLDDNEGHYLKVIMDEILGRKNFVSTVIWQKADSPRNSARQFSSDHDYIFVYSRNDEWQPKRLPRTDEANSIYVIRTTTLGGLGFRVTHMRTSRILVVNTQLQDQQAEYSLRRLVDIGVSQKIVYAN